MELVKLLRQRVGPNFRAEEEESAMHGLYSVLMSFIFIFAAIAIGFVAFRWIMGGGELTTYLRPQQAQALRGKRPGYQLRGRGRGR